MTALRLVKRYGGVLSRRFVYMFLRLTMSLATKLPTILPKTGASARRSQRDILCPVGAQDLHRLCTGRLEHWDGGTLCDRKFTGVVIAQYLDTRDDFDLERFAYRALKGKKGWIVSLGAATQTPIAQGETDTTAFESE